MLSSQHSSSPAPGIDNISVEVPPGKLIEAGPVIEKPVGSMPAPAEAETPIKDEYVKRAPTNPFGPVSVIVLDFVNISSSNFPEIVQKN